MLLSEQKGDGETVPGTADYEHDGWLLSVIS